MWRDQYRGVLLGLAVGDALGGPLEFMSPEEITQRYGGPLRELSGGGWLYLRPGETTDDTACTRCLAESIVDRGVVDPDDIAARLLAWADTQPKDIGTITRYALDGWRRGLRGIDAAQQAHINLGGQSAGNGSLMRCAPIALRYPYDDAAIIWASRSVARLTHFDPLAWTSDALFNLTLARMLRGMQLADAANEAIELVEQAEGYAPEATVVLSRALQRQDAQGLGNSGFVLHTLEAAIWVALQAPDLENALVTIANMGGDADTAAAVCGVLCGARWGAQAIPPRWLERLEGRAELELLADQLADLAQSELRKGGE